MNSYLSVHDYIRAVTGQGVQTLYGNLMRLTQGIVQGATSLPVGPNTSVNLAIDDPITIFDGSNTEVVTVTAATVPGAATILVTATLYAHAQYTSCCSDGPQGSLAESIIEGSAVVERICRQPLLQATYTSETLPLLSTRAWVDSSMALGIRPRQFPVQSVSAVSLLLAGPVTLSLDLANLSVDAIQRLVTLSVIKMIQGNGNTLPVRSTINQGTEGKVQISYTAGFAYAQLPPIVKRMATLLTSDILSDRANPTGAAELQQGKLKQTAFLRGDLTGESALFKRARMGLKPYTAEAW